MKIILTLLLLLPSYAFALDYKNKVFTVRSHMSRGAPECVLSVNRQIHFQFKDGDLIAAFYTNKGGSSILGPKTKPDASHLLFEFYDNFDPTADIFTSLDVQVLPSNWAPLDVQVLPSYWAPNVKKFTLADGFELLSAMQRGVELEIQAWTGVTGPWTKNAKIIWVTQISLAGFNKALSSAKVCNFEKQIK